MAVRNKQVADLLEQLAREFGITTEQAEDIYSLRFKFVRECMSSTPLDEVYQTGKVKSIRWIGMGEFYPSGKRIKDYITRRKKKEDTNESI
jgi:hypothetical protein